MQPLRLMMGVCSNHGMGAHRAGGHHMNEIEPGSAHQWQCVSQRRRHHPLRDLEQRLSTEVHHLQTSRMASEHCALNENTEQELVYHDFKPLKSAPEEMCPNGSSLLFWRLLAS